MAKFEIAGMCRRIVDPVLTRQIVDPRKLWSRRGDLNPRPADYELSPHQSESTEENLLAPESNDLDDP